MHPGYGSGGYFACPSTRLDPGTTQPSDLHIEDVLIDRVTVIGVLDKPEAAPGDASFDLASLTLAYPG